MTRVHAADGSLVAEYARERRLYIPIQAVPEAGDQRLPRGRGQEFLRAWRARFHRHRARRLSTMSQNFGTGRRPQGASTITQQVAKNFLLIKRGFASAARSRKRCWRSRSSALTRKDKILELYLNEIYLGLGAYGVAAASLTLFRQVGQRTDRPGSRLSRRAAEGAQQLSSVPPARARDRAAQLGARPDGAGRLHQGRRRREGQAYAARRHARRPTSAHTFAAEYFAEEVRRELYDRYGEKKLYEGGLSVRTTLDTKLQVLARKTLHDGLVKFDESAGLARPGQQDRHLRRLGRQARRREGARPTSRPGGSRWCSRPATVGAHRLAARTRAGRRRQQGARHRHRPARRREVGQGQAARRSSKVSQVLEPGDVVYVEPAKDDGPIPPAPDAGSLRRHGGRGSAGPAACSPWSAASPTTRASSTARRRRCASPAPRSSRSSMPRRSTTATRRRRWCSTRRSRSIRARASACGSRKTTSSNFYGPSTLRFGIEHSRNVMTVRLAQDVGMPLIAEYAKRFGVYDDLPPYLSFALGAGETTLMRMVTAYAMFDNGGRRDEADADRPHPGPLRPHRLPPRPARMHRLRRQEMGRTSRSRRWSTGASRCSIR